MVSRRPWSDCRCHHDVPFACRRSFARPRSSCDYFGAIPGFVGLLCALFFADEPEADAFSSQGLCRYVSALEVDLNGAQTVYELLAGLSLTLPRLAVERVVELLETPQEPPMIIEGKRPPAYWPSDQGGIVVDDLVMSYAPALPPVLKHVSFEIKPKQKVGVVGRTGESFCVRVCLDILTLAEGSGKSTLGMSLLRFAEPTSGRILYVLSLARAPKVG